MKFGVILPNYGPSATPEDLLDTARQAERLGFDSIWTTDHLLLPSEDADRYGVIYEAVATLAYLGGATSRIRLGISSLVLPQRNPIVVAKQIAALDQLSEGRVILCVGVGWSAGEFQNLDHRFDDRGRRTDEAMEVLRALWSGDEAVKRYSGEYYGFADAVFAPPPAQPGGPPLWVGGNSQAAIRRAARLSDGWHPTGTTLETFRRGVELCRELAGGRDLTYSLRARLSFEPEDTPSLLHGEPDEVIASLREYEKAGLEYAVITFPEDSATVRQAAIERFADKVLPVLADGQP